MAEPRKKRTTRPETYSFTLVLEKAEKLLQRKKEQRKKAVDSIALLDVEIGGLEGTIAALSRQLNPGAAVIPPMISAPLGPGTYVREVPEGAGSILMGAGEPPQQLAPELDALKIPGMEGDFA